MAMRLCGVPMAELDLADVQTDDHGALAERAVLLAPPVRSANVHPELHMR